MQPENNELYRDIILDHCESPRNRGEPANYSNCLTRKDPETGDEVTLWLLYHRAHVSEIAWEAKGSNLLLASCSIMSETLTGKSIKEAVAFIGQFMAMLTSESNAFHWDQLGEAASLSGIRHLPARVNCTSMPWRTAEQALRQQMENQ